MAPVSLLFFNKAVMLGSLLIGIVARPVVKNNVQSDIEIPVIDLPGEIGIQLTGREKDHPGVIRKIFFAGSDEVIHSLGRSIIQSEINIVRKHAVLPSYFVLSWKTET